MIKFSDVFDLYEMTSFGESYGVEGYICRNTGKTWLYSKDGDNEEALPDDIDSDQYLMMPAKKELGLGRNLVFDFVSEHLPQQYEKVSEYFSKKGAYTKYKLLLEKEGKLDLWYQYETEQAKKALRDWCSENELNVIDG